MSSPKKAVYARVKKADGTMMNKKIEGKAFVNGVKRNIFKSASGCYYKAGKNKIPISCKDIYPVGARMVGCKKPGMSKRVVSAKGKSRCVASNKDFAEMCREKGKVMHKTDKRRTCVKVKKTRARSPSKSPRKLNPAMTKWDKAVVKARQEVPSMRLVKGNALYRRAHEYFVQASGSR